MTERVTLYRVGWENGQPTINKEMYSPRMTEIFLKRSDSNYFLDLEEAKDIILTEIMKQKDALLQQVNELDQKFLSIVKINEADL